MIDVVTVMTAAGGLTLGGSPCTVMRQQTSDVHCTPSFITSSVDCHHQPYMARKQRRNRTTFTLMQVSSYQQSEYCAMFDMVKLTHPKSTRPKVNSFSRVGLTWGLDDCKPFDKTIKSNVESVMAAKTER